MRFTIKADGEPSIVINDTRGNRIGWYLMEEGVDGWFNTPAPREEVFEHPMQDGGIRPSKLTQEPRSFSLYLGFRFRSSIRAADAIDDLNGLFGKELTVRSDNASEIREAKCFMSATPEIQFLDEEELILATVFFTCPDPHKYSLARTYAASGSKITVKNRGNCDTWPVIHSTGNTTHLELTFGGHSVKWEGSTTSLDIDFRSGECSSGKLTVDDAFSIPPGTHSVIVSSDGNVSMLIRDAWR